MQGVHLFSPVWEGSFQGAPQALDLGSVEGDEAHRDRPGWGPALLFQAQGVHGEVLPQAGQQCHAQLRLSLTMKQGVRLGGSRNGGMNEDSVVLMVGEVRMLLLAQGVHGEVFLQAGQQCHAQLRLSLIISQGVKIRVAANKGLRSEG